MAALKIYRMVVSRKVNKSITLEGEGLGAAEAYSALRSTALTIVSIVIL